MTTDILLKPQQLYKEYMSLIMKHDTLKTSLERTVAVISLAPGHGQGVSRRLEEMEAEILDLEKIIDLKNEELMDAQAEVRAFISQLDDSFGRQMLEMRFVDLMTLKEISEEKHFSIQYCWRKIQDAAEQLQKVNKG